MFSNVNQFASESEGLKTVDDMDSNNASEGHYIPAASPMILAKQQNRAR